LLSPRAPIGGLLGSFEIVTKLVPVEDERLTNVEAVQRRADAKSILGFGNRSPSHATRYAEGCAYLLLGVEPGNLTGTKVHDPADVEQWLPRY